MSEPVAPVSIRTLAIIGTSTPERSSAVFDAKTYERIVKYTIEWAKASAIDPETVVLVCGCRPWAEHVAITLFLKHGFKHLRIHTPYPLRDGAFAPHSSIPDKGKRQDGSTLLNRMHESFSDDREAGSSMAEIEAAIARGAEVVQCTGYFEADVDERMPANRRRPHGVAGRQHQEQDAHVDPRHRQAYGLGKDGGQATSLDAAGWLGAARPSLQVLWTSPSSRASPVAREGRGRQRAQGTDTRQGGLNLI